MGASFSIYAQDDTIYRKYGWVVDTPDQRDHHYEINSIDYKKIVDLRCKCPGIYNQGKLGSCTANAIAAAYEFDMMKQNEDNIFTPSRLFIYYNERDMENTVNSDSGAQIRDGIKSINSLKNKITIIIVTHRLHTVKDCEKILFLKNGKLIDSGNLEYLKNKYPEDF